MRANENTRIKGNKVLLVPYEKKHVEKYHVWMQDPELQELTASEPLSLEQEYDMQLSWRMDSDKCTFIVLDHQVFKASYDELEAMIGDVNIFLSRDDPRQGEVEIMIAEKSKRCCGRGKEAMLNMMRYGTEELGITSFVAKIKENNTISLNLFKSLGFFEISRSEVFQEVTLFCLISDQWKQRLVAWTPFYQLEFLNLT